MHRQNRDGAAAALDLWFAGGAKCQNSRRNFQGIPCPRSLTNKECNHCKTYAGQSASNCFIFFKTFKSNGSVYEGTSQLHDLLRHILDINVSFRIIIDSQSLEYVTVVI